LFFSDFWASSYYLVNETDQSFGDAYVAEVPGTPQVNYSAGYPPSNPVAGNPVVPPVPANAPRAGTPPRPAGRYNPYRRGNPPVPGTPLVHGHPANIPVPGRPGVPPTNFKAVVNPINAVPANPGTSYRTTKPDDSYYGTIYRADAFVYTRGSNGSNLFNRFSHIGYNRPCGITGYPVGPWNEFRLVYTNGETQLLSPTTLVTDTYTELLAARGREVNGLSQVFTRHNVLASGKNIHTITDFGYGNQNGLLVTVSKELASSDYTVLAQAANGDTLTVPTLHLQDHPTFNKVSDQLGGFQRKRLDTLQYLVDDPALYQAKNTRQFRICYDDKITDIDALPHAAVVNPRTVNTVFFAVIQ